MEGDWCGRAELLLETVRSVQQRSVPPQFGRPDRPLPHGRWTCPRSALQMAQMDLREGEAPSPSAHLGDPAGAHPPRCSIWEEEPRESLRRQHPRERAGEAGLALGIAEAFRERTSKGRLSARFPSRTSHPGPPRDEPDPDAVDDRGSRRRFVHFTSQWSHKVAPGPNFARESADVAQQTAGPGSSCRSTLKASRSLLRGFF
ncbi:uncharacterized protein LOC114813843 isoform X1 [Ornithorhynchus anatinus]|uniref:uncharacterized protein LOC114813843 isoform X1 n=1 Tax=Ornithorhynchus anatinus TaxID=9258 RepID=UPI0010A8A150|nr:uncharacterized protein LOC114813843 isoform X1 [Ornithorhynchus anatinus]